MEEGGTYAQVQCLHYYMTSPALDPTQDLSWCLRMYLVWSSCPRSQRALSKLKAEGCEVGEAEGRGC